MVMHMKFEPKVVKIKNHEELKKSYDSGKMRKLIGKVDKFCSNPYCGNWITFGEYGECPRCGEIRFLTDDFK